MRRRIICLFLTLILLCGTVSAAGPAKSPYAIKVNRALNTVTVYGLDENGNHTVPVKAMICSTARAGYYTPLGTFTIIGYRSEWRYMLDGTYGQYATCFKGNYLFHSICYHEPSKDAMIREEYNALGTAASMGCVRLQTVDAKWIYDNCPAGTKVTVYEDFDDPGPLGKPEKLIDHITEEMYQVFSGWDPTDPAAENPWTFVEAESVEFFPDDVTVVAGNKEPLMTHVYPEEAAVCGLVWESSDSAIAKVDGRGNVIGLMPGTVEITASSWNGVSDTCTVTVEGELLPFDDLTPGAWYYKELRGALDEGILQGMGDRQFGPSLSMTRAMVVQTMYNMEGRPEVEGDLPFTDVGETAWYRPAVLWAYQNNMVKGVSETEFMPNKAMNRQELAAVLWRYAGQPEMEGDMTDYTDVGQIAEYARIPMLWLTQNSLMQGGEGLIQPRNVVTRIETAVVLYRYSQLK